ncbi:hypothetical protein [Fibrivirga algicola]|uniref:Anti-sigma factor n=1 Tax=Fibrivirga algicola TaxID=2950420 RepID=A0ABX0Q9Q9_9BACT|nr:hypothetical protein [Fibrivirga algicola]ARK08916.1 hypothetical protein A6C57_00545 [Fibrella sp. ES10-3-2-2]NID08905.1 hypothetical protein [Fibrivirga algicola]
MTKTFTQDDVIRYVYEETSEEENLLIEEALMAEPELMGFFLDTLELRALMDKIERAPRPSALSAILSYSSFHPNSPVSNPNGVA